MGQSRGGGWVIFYMFIRVQFLGESKKGFVISDHMDSSPPKKEWKIQKRIICRDSARVHVSSFINISAVYRIEY